MNTTNEQPEVGRNRPTYCTRSRPVDAFHWTGENPNAVRDWVNATTHSVTWIQVNDDLLQFAFDDELERGRLILVRPGMWLVHDNGRWSTYSQEQFDELFTPAPPQHLVRTFEQYHALPDQSILEVVTPDSRSYWCSEGDVARWADGRLLLPKIGLGADALEASMPITCRVVEWGPTA